MTWQKREAVTNLVILGDGEGSVKKASGLLIATPPDRGYPDKNNYVLVQQNGDEITVSGSASLARQINEQDVGRFVKLEFTGWGKSANGKFKMIEVNVYEGEPTDAMKKWPRFAEFQKNGKKPGVTKEQVQDEFDAAPIEDDGDLPF